MTDRPSTGPVQYKGEDLDSERGPGLGCFRFQLALLVFLVVLTPLSVAWHWPTWLSAVLLFAVLILLLFAGQTVIFLLRLTAAASRISGGRLRHLGQLGDDLDVRQPFEDRRRPDHLPASTATAEHDPLAIHDPRVDPDRHAVR